MAKVEIFYAQMCGLCHRAMDYFTEKGVAFDSYEVQWKDGAWVDSDNVRDMLRRCGNVDFVPQIIIDDRPIEGYRKLEKLIDTGEIDALIGGRS